MSKPSVTFGVTIERANDREPIRVHGIEMFIARVVEIWPNGSGGYTRNVVKLFRFYSAGKANQEAELYVAKTYKREKGDALNE